jgi:DNA-binding IclR family transcriptional regulator
VSAKPLRAESEAADDPNVIGAGLKALEALRVVVSEPESISLAALAERLRVSKPTAYRIARTLAQAGFIVPIGGRNGYRATMAVVELASQILERTPVRELAVPVLARVAENFGESVTVAVPESDHIVFVEQISVDRNVDFYCGTGKRLPLHVGAAARCILAYYTDDLFEQYIARDLTAYTIATKTDPKLLRADRAEIRDRGFAVSVEDVEIGISGVGVPLLNRGGEILGAATIANITARWDAAAISDRAAAMVDAARTIGELAASLPAQVMTL